MLKTETRGGVVLGESEVDVTDKRSSQHTYLGDYSNKKQKTTYLGERPVPLVGLLFIQINWSVK